jgi:hypothetical protein
MFLHITAKSTFALLLLLALTAGASAQGPAPATKVAQAPGTTVIQLGQRNPDALLLARPAVQDDLKLTADQKKKLDRLEKARLDRARQVEQMARGGNQNEFGQQPQVDVQTLQQHENELNEEVATSIGQILSPRQRQRLAQISLQVEGAMAFAREDVLEKLNVDELQIESLRTILEGTREQIGQNTFIADNSNPEGRRLGAGLQERVDAVPQGNPGAGRKVDPGVGKPNGQVLDEALRKIGRVLRKNQWDTYTRLKGAPFDLAKLNSDQSGSKEPSKPATTVAEQPKDESKPPESKPAEPKTSTKKSLRQRRGSTGEQP